MRKRNPFDCSFSFLPFQVDIIKDLLTITGTQNIRRGGKEAKRWKDR
jgi:hypothetical protein